MITITNEDNMELMARYKAFENTHDLQNFFFALNGQELTIKDNSYIRN